MKCSVRLVLSDKDTTSWVVSAMSPEARRQLRKQFAKYIICYCQILFDSNDDHLSLVFKKVFVVES